MRFFAACLIAAMSCGAHADVVQVSGDTYMAYRISHAGAFANMSKLKAVVIREANEFAARQGKIAVPVSAAVEKRPNPGFPSVEYQFRVVAKDDPTAQNRSIPAQADMVVDSSTEVRTTSDQKPDLYTELTKLDDLRKRGLLTDQEFDAQKKRLLER